MNGRRPRILFSSPVLGHPSKGGPELRIENSIKALASISELYLYARISPAAVGGDRAIAFYRTIVADMFFAPSFYKRNLLRRIVRSSINRLSRIFIRRSLLPGSSEHESDYQDLVTRATELGADIIWLGYGNISYPLMKYIKMRSTIPVVVDTDSVWSRYVLRGLPFASNETTRKQIETEGRLKQAEERWGTQLADVTTGVSEVDVQYYRKLTDRPASVCLFSNVIDLDSYSQVSPPAGFKKPCMYLAGSFWPGSPMEDAARWMLDHVLPLLKRALPDIHFYIVGRGSVKVLSDIHDDSVTIAGEVSSVLPYLTNASVAVVPLRFESGTRFKILEAGACGVPVVSTTLGAEGIPVVNGKDILIADSPEDFARSVISVIRDRQHAVYLGQRLRELVASRFSIKALAREGEDILEYLRAQKVSVRTIDR